MNEMTGLSEIKTTEIGAKSPDSGSELRSAREYIKDVCAPKEYFDEMVTNIVREMNCCQITIMR